MHARGSLVSAVGLAAAALALAGCGPSSSGTADHDASGGRSQVAAPSASAPAPSQDLRACAGIQSVMGHLAVDTRGWSPSLHPFNKAVAARIRLRAQELDLQAPQARSEHVREAAHATADAFGLIVDAMTDRRTAGVQRHVRNSRVAYRDLKQVCGLH